jgi:hypothetical protein
MIRIFFNLYIKNLKKTQKKRRVEFTLNFFLKLPHFFCQENNKDFCFKKTLHVMFTRIIVKVTFAWHDDLVHVTIRKVTSTHDVYFLLKNRPNFKG